MQSKNKNQMFARSLLSAGISIGLLASAGTQAATTENSFSGYVKMDAIFSQEDDSTAGLRDQALLTLNADQAEDEEGELYMSAWESRIKFTSDTKDVEFGNLKAVIEGDMYSGDTNNFNLRHAYVQHNNLTLGQTWSTFMDLGALAETADFGGPAARIFTRQPLVRYSMNMASGTLDLAAEKPKNAADPVLPDFVARYTHKADFGHITGAALVQYINEDDGTNDDNTMALGLRVSGRINLGENNLKFAVINGEGLGGYMNFGDQAAYDLSSGEMELSQQTGFKIAYQQVFSSDLRSTIRYAQTSNEINDVDTGDFSSIHANLIYAPYKRIKYGIELINATKSKAEGNALTEDRKLNRLHLFAKYTF